MEGRHEFVTDDHDAKIELLIEVGSPPTRKVQRSYLLIQQVKDLPVELAQLLLKSYRTAERVISLADAPE